MKRFVALTLTCLVLTFSAHAQRDRGNRGGNGGNHYLPRFDRAQDHFFNAARMLDSEDDFIHPTNQSQAKKRLIAIYLKNRSAWIGLENQFEINPVSDWLYEDFDQKQETPKMAMARVNGSSTPETAHTIDFSLPYAEEHQISLRDAFVNVVHETGHLLRESESLFGGHRSHDLLDEIGRVLEKEYFDARNMEFALEFMSWDQLEGKHQHFPTIRDLQYDLEIAQKIIERLRTLLKDEDWDFKTLASRKDDLSDELDRLSGQLERSSRRVDALLKKDLKGTPVNLDLLLIR